MAEDLLRLRFKGTVTGPHPRSEILERLAAHALSLAHCVEHRGRWVTLRAYLRETTPSLAAGTSAPPGLDAAGMIPPPPPGPGAAERQLERLTQRAYLWCGLTFGLPSLALGALWLASWVMSGGFPRGSALFCLLVFALGAVATWRAWHRARGAADELDAEGLGDVGRSVRQLADGLGAGSALLWLVVAAGIY